MDIHGVVEFEIKGKKRGFRNDQYGLLLAVRKDGGHYQDLMDRVEQGDTLAFINLMYGMAASYCEAKSLKVDFTVNDMGDWLSELGAEKMREYFQQLFKTPEVPKNSLSPQETGVPTS